MKRLRLAFVCLAIGSIPRVEASPCCAGAAAMPTLIAGDDSAQMSLSVSQSEVIGDAPTTGIPVFRSDSDQELTQTLRLDGAYLLSEYWQIGASLPFVRRSVERPRMESGYGSGVGDVQVTTGFEFLPELTYSYWKPRGVVFLQLTLPTGTSVYDDPMPPAADLRGKGFYTLSTGMLLLKKWSSFDLQVLPEVHYSFSRTVTQFGKTTELEPNWGGSVVLGLGLSPGEGAFRIGGRIQPIFNGPRSSGEGDQLYWNTTLDLSYLFLDTWTLSASYIDQTLVGPAVNTTLSRTVALALQHRWLR